MPRSFEGQCSVQSDGLALVLFFKVGAERQQHAGPPSVGYQ